MMKYNYGKQDISKKDILAVNKVLRSDFITQGKEIENFEKKLSKYFGFKYSTVTSSGTAALHLAGKILKWRKNDVILVSANTFLASANSSEYCGSKTDFIDIDKNDYNICIKSLEKKLFNLKEKKITVNTVIVTDFAGHPAKWREINKLKKKYKFFLINDNCHAMGSKYFGKKEYSSKYADLSILSFHAVKSITCGEGGALLTNNKQKDGLAKLYRSHGVVKKSYHQLDMLELGYNYRITDFQCALGISQLSQINKFVLKRRKIAQMYNKFLLSNHLVKPKEFGKIYHSYHLYVVLINFKKLRINKEEFINLLKKFGVKTQIHYKPIYLNTYYQKKYKLNKNYCPESMSYYSKCLSLPIYTSLNQSDIRFISGKINFLIKKYAKE